MKGASVKPISVNATLDLEVRYSHVYDNILLIYCSKTQNQHCIILWCKRCV